MSRCTRLAPVLLAASIAPAIAAQEKQDLRVLYAGNPEGERMADFGSFLGEHFAEVGTISYEAVTADAAAAYDVVIFDWTSVLPRDETGAVKRDMMSLHSPAAPKLPDDWDRPSILIGSAGERVAELFRSKIDWL